MFNNNDGNNRWRIVPMKRGGYRIEPGSILDGIESPAGIVAAIVIIGYAAYKIYQVLAPLLYGSFFIMF